MGEYFDRRRSEFNSRIRNVPLANPKRERPVQLSDGRIVYTTMSKEDAEQFFWEMENIVFKGHEERVAEMERRGISYLKRGDIPQTTRRYTNPGKTRVGKTLKTLFKVFGTAAVIGALAFAINKGQEDFYKTLPENQPITMEQAIGNGITLEEMSITQETEDKIVAIQDRLNSEDIGNIGDTQLIELGKEIDDIQLNKIFKTKVADALGINPEQISVYYKAASGSNEYNSQESFAMDIKDDEGKVTSSYGQENMSEEIRKYIRNISDIQSLVTSMENSGDISRYSTIGEYKSAMEETSKFVAGKIKFDGKDFTLEQQTQKDIDGSLEIADDGEER